MAITSTQSKQPASVVNTTVGRYKTTSTAAAFTITTGFKPRYVRVVNLDDRVAVEWFEGMADASALRIDADNARTIITTLGITVSANGFTLGLETGVNVKDKQLSWIAQC